MSILIPPRTIDRENTIWYAMMLHSLYREAGANPKEITTDTSGNAVVQAYQLSDACTVYVRTTFDLPSPFQQLWYQEYDNVIQIHLKSDFTMYGEAIEETWRLQVASNLTAQKFRVAITELLLKLALLAIRSEHEKIRAARSLLA